MVDMIRIRRVVDLDFIKDSSFLCLDGNGDWVGWLMINLFSLEYLLYEINIYLDKIKG